MRVAQRSVVQTIQFGIVLPTYVQYSRQGLSDYIKEENNATDAREIHEGLYSLLLIGELHFRSRE